MVSISRSGLADMFLTNVTYSWLTFVPILSKRHSRSRIKKPNNFEFVNKCKNKKKSIKLWGGGLGECPPEKNLAVSMSKKSLLEYLEIRLWWMRTLFFTGTVKSEAFSVLDLKQLWIVATQYPEKSYWSSEYEHQILVWSNKLKNTYIILYYQLHKNLGCINVFIL